MKLRKPVVLSNISSNELWSSASVRIGSYKELGYMFNRIFSRISSQLSLPMTSSRLLTITVKPPLLIYISTYNLSSGMNKCIVITKFILWVLFEA
jgi:hypothetical protein